MPLKLTEKEIKQRLIRLRNLERLYARQCEVNQVVKEQNRLLREKITLLEQTISTYEQLKESLSIRIAELERMVFGRKKNKKDKTPPDDISGSDSDTGNQQSSKPSRPKDSYRRPTPPDEAVTDEEYVPVSECGHCHGPLTDLRDYVRYIEDIVLAALADARFKTVTKLTIQRGWCTRCGKYTAARDLRGQDVSLGPNVRLLVSYLTTILDMTYSQVRTVLGDLSFLPGRK
jgi:hypothetical protein